MKKRLMFLLLVMLCAFSAGVAAETVDIFFFYGKGCPHCNRAEVFFEEMNEKYDLNVTLYETYSDPAGRDAFEKMTKAFGTEIKGVPTIFIDGKVIVGFSDSIAQTVEDTIKECAQYGCPSPKQWLANDVILVETESSPEEEPGKTELKKKLTIPAVVGAALVDAINPCAFAVLIILMTTVLGSGSRRRALLAGLAFTFSIYISYFLMGLGLYSAVQASGFTHGFFGVVAVAAIVLGLFNLKDYLWYGKWFIMEVPMSWRPSLKKLLKGVTSIPGAFFIGFVISLFLLPCTSGPYIVILGLLAETTTRSYAVLLLLLYNLVFVLPMLIITAMVGFGHTTVHKAEKWRTGKLEVLHLIAGVILLLLGIGMLVALWYGWV
ncbi:cytochrome c biogenesis protein CcdA [Nanoarchaeota archaeon]